MPTAPKLTATLFQMLKPGGILLVANFLPAFPNIGYMECSMDCYLTYRSDLEKLAGDIKHDEIGNTKTFSDADKAIGYLQLCRA
jgi:hypothetical protein